MSIITNKSLTRVAGIPVLPQLPYHLAFTQGMIYHVKPYTGSDSNDGLSPAKALKTLARAQVLATADQNDIVLLYSESNTAASTFDLQSETLTWAKDGVHLIGVGSGTNFGIRSGLRFIDAYNTASNLFTLSADNCYIANIYFYVGVAGTSPTGCLYMTGSHNHFENCHIAGMGYSTNVIASAYSLSMSAAEENLFERCMIGYGQQRGAQATSEIYFASQCARTTFRECTLFCGTSSATNHVFVTVAASGLLDFLHFDRCSFINAGVNGGGTNITYAMAVNAAPGGTILLSHCASAGITDWSNDCGSIWGPIYSTTADGGIGAVLVK